MKIASKWILYAADWKKQLDDGAMATELAKKHGVAPITIRRIVEAEFGKGA